MQKDLSSDPEALSNLYLDITDDLGYAQTYYKRRTIRVYLNQLAQRVFIGVNKYQKFSFKNVAIDVLITSQLRAALILNKNVNILDEVSIFSKLS